MFSMSCEFEPKRKFETWTQDGSSSSSFSPFLSVLAVEAIDGRSARFGQFEGERSRALCTCFRTFFFEKFADYGHEDGLYDTYTSNLGEAFQYSGEAGISLKIVCGKSDK